MTLTCKSNGTEEQFIKPTKQTYNCAKHEASITLLLNVIRVFKFSWSG